MSSPKSASEQILKHRMEQILSEVKTNVKVMNRHCQNTLWFSCVRAFLMERTEIENKWISKIKLSWTGSTNTADGVVHRNYEVVLRKVKFLSKDKTLQKQADRRWNKSFVEAIRLCGTWPFPGVLTNQHKLYDRDLQHCTMCILGTMFTFQPNKLRHILKVASW